jgi:trans-feruloyl-CoA hydratase/vanillin synthase
LSTKKAAARPSRAAAPEKERPEKERAEKDTVSFRVADGVAWVAFNRPEKRNAMSPKLNRRMMEVLDQLEYRDDVGVLVLTGEGQAWSAGMDLKEYFRETEAHGLGAVRQSQRESYGWWRRLRWYQKPTIAMVNGWCFGGAFTPLCSCDLAICADEATFGLSEINWGIIPAGNVAKAFAEKVSPADAAYYMMTGDTFDGQRANAMRLVNASVPRAQLREHTEALARKLMQKNPHVLWAVKDAGRRLKSMTWDEAEEYLYAKAQATYSTDPEQGRKKGMDQFLEEKSYRPGLKNYRRE